jgi:hypothetical protein
MTLLENYHENFSALLEYIKEYGKDPESFSVKKFDFNITKLNSYLKKNFFLSYLR